MVGAAEPVRVRAVRKWLKVEIELSQSERFVGPGLTGLANRSRHLTRAALTEAPWAKTAAAPEQALQRPEGTAHWIPLLCVPH